MYQNYQILAVMNVGLIRELELLHFSARRWGE